MFFWDHLEQFADSTAVIDETGRTFSYAQLLKKADAVAETIPPRSVVFLVCENSFEAIACYIGFLRRRAVTVLINGSIAPEKLHTLKNAYRPQYLCCRKDGAYQLIRTEYTSIPESNPDLGVLITTSGSTGSAKLVMQSYENIQANTESIIAYLGIRPDDRAITTMPMSYTFGLSIIQTHLCAGACLIASEHSMTEKAFWTLLREQQATTFGGVPYLYEILKKLRFSRMDLPSLRYLTQAGGKLSKELVQEFIQVCTEKQMRFIVMYGQTEATARMSYLPWDRAAEKTGSIGIAIPGGKFELVGEQGERITAPETAGELVYSGKNVTLGYAVSQEDFCKPPQWNGVLHTGDMAKFDKDGFFYIVGRKKRFLKLFGNRVNLDEVETMLKNAGFEGVCSGTDDLLKLYLVNADEQTCQKAIDFLSKETSLHHSAFTVRSIPEIPRNDSGKVQYSRLEELL